MKHSKGICVAGTMIADTTYPIETWPRQNELTHITEGIKRTAGGAVCSCLMDLAQLDPELHLLASGVAAHDSDGDFLISEMEKFPSIDLSMVRRDVDRTSFTMVMSNNRTKERTFFQHTGGNALYGEDFIDWDRMSEVDIFHIGYIFLLPNLDQEDSEYGTRMARLLHRAQSIGLRTSVDVVSETSDRFIKLVTPALRYTDFCIINELEAQQTTGVILREEDGTLHPENFEKALRALFKLGVSTWCVIHCPEMGCGMDSSGDIVTVPSLKLPEGWIKGTVGAGDAFCAGVLYGAEKDKTLRESIIIGNCAAAASLSDISGSGGMKPLDEVLTYWDKYR